VWTALLWKELRECGLYAALALLAMMYFLGAGMDLPLIPIFSQGRGGEIPFVSASGEFSRETYFSTVAILAAIVIGLQQTLWESWRQTTLFLLHRPMPRMQIFLGKLGAGSLLILAVIGGPLLLYCFWAAMPGTHASPFYWGMTESWWRSVAAALVCYLGAFLTGLRPAYWIGSRTWPLIAALAMSLGLKNVSFAASLVYAAYGLLIACYLVCILETAREREYP
jgi:hypothetical protein